MKLQMALALSIVIIISMVAIERGTFSPSMPRKLPDGRVYRQWCCSKCETWNKGYGTPYTCEKCGNTMDW
jgi:hypothetical protein